VSTIAWLGPSDEQTEVAFRKHKYLSNLWINGLRDLDLGEESEHDKEKIGSTREVEFGTEEALVAWKAVISFSERY
jgi:hypothetical protein